MTTTIKPFLTPLICLQASLLLVSPWAFAEDSANTQSTNAQTDNVQFGTTTNTDQATTKNKEEVITLNTPSKAAILGITPVLVEVEPSFSQASVEIHIAGLYLQPSSDNLDYGIFVYGPQPHTPNWDTQSVSPSYSTGIDLGILYAFGDSPYSVSLDWTHFRSTDSDEKQADASLPVTDVQFVAPPYDVGPEVFGIKHAQSTVKFEFDSVFLNVGRFFHHGTHLQTRFFGGLNYLRINQTIKTIFNDYAGTVATPLTNATAADPNYYFQTKNSSEYWGIGPDIGVNIRYTGEWGFGVVGQIAGTIAAGSVETDDQFTSASTFLESIGIKSNQQILDASNKMQVVPGIDSKLGLFYANTIGQGAIVALELGYRLAYYDNAIVEVSPDTVVQTGLTNLPNFATGTMAISSTQTKDSAFSLGGPYLQLSVALL